MAYSLHAGFNDADLNSANAIQFDLDGAGPWTATVTPPSTGGTGGYYWTVDDSLGAAVSLLQAVEDALEAADPDGANWIVSLDNSEMPLKCSIQRAAGGARTNWTVDWTAGPTTFDPLWLGFASGSDIGAAVGASVVSDYQVQRAWYYKSDNWYPQRHAFHGKQTWKETGAGVLVSHTWGNHGYRLKFNHPVVEGARVYTTHAADADLYTAVAGLAQGDPHIALEELMYWIREGRTRIAYQLDPHGSPSVTYWRPTDGAGQSVDAWITSRANEPVVYGVGFDLTKWV